MFDVTHYYTHATPDKLDTFEHNVTVSIKSLQGLTILNVLGPGTHNVWLPGFLAAALT